MVKKLIDVSAWQGVINWEQVKDHVDGAILRCGFGADLPGQDDSYFQRNAEECTRLGIPFGVYLYSYADTVEKAESEATHILRLIAPYALSYPVYLDVEEKKYRDFAKTACQIVKERVAGAGYPFGVYASLSWWNTVLADLAVDSKWVAQIHSRCDYEKPFDIWQYSWTGQVPGIRGNVDVNKCYRDFTGEAAPAPVDPEAALEEIAWQVLQGKWGNGEARKAALLAAGYDYTRVQEAVTGLFDQFLDALAREVIQGKWGNGEERKARLTAAGHDYGAVQARVNTLMG